MNRKSIEWLDSLKARRDGCAERLKQPAVTELDRARRTIDLAYRDLYQIIITEAAWVLPKIEAESFLVPPDDTDLRERLMGEEFTA